MTSETKRQTSTNKSYHIIVANGLIRLSEELCQAINSSNTEGTIEDFSALFSEPYRKTIKHIFNNISEFAGASADFRLLGSGKVTISVIGQNSDNKNAYDCHITLEDSLSEMETHESNIIGGHNPVTEAIYDNLPVAVELYNKDGILVHINHKELIIFDIPSPGDVLGYCIYNDPNIPDHVQERIKNGEEFEFTINYDFTKGYDLFTCSRKRSDKPSLHYRVAQIKDSDNNRDGFLLIITDQTDELLTQDKLKDSDIFISAIAEYAKIGVAKFDLVTNMRITSAQWVKNILKHNYSSIASVNIIDIMHPEDREHISSMMQKARSGEISTFKHDIRFNDNAGGWRWNTMYFKVTDYRPAQGVITLHAINIEITDKKLDEQKLIEAKLRAEESDRLKSAFLANMSHEICTPLNAIVGFSSLIADGTNPEDADEFIDAIHRNNEYLLKLVSDILDLSKIESGILRMVKSEFKLQDLLKDIELTYTLRDTESVRIEVLPTNNTCVINSDKMRLTQVISNFMNNALKFTKAGYVRLGSEVSADQVMIYVEDSGIGIHEDKLDMIFERFTKLNNFIPGTGLGLSICKSIMDQLDGSIGVTSEYGKGSRFWLTIKCSNCTDHTDC